MFNTGDFNDSMLQTVQQFPMVIFYYKRQIKRIDVLINKYNEKLERMIKKLPRRNESKIKKLEKNFEKAFREKKELLTFLSESLEKHLSYFNELNNMSGNQINTPLIEYEVRDKNTLNKCQMTLKVEGEAENKIYCTCMNKARGNMIRCNNETCEIGWYHFKCVGLLKAPKQTWTCSRCVDK